MVRSIQLCRCLTASATALAGAAASRAQEPAPAVWAAGSIYPDLDAAPPQDVADARRLWQRSKNAAKRLFPTVAATRARGYRGHIKHINRPKPFFFHLRNTKLHDDGRELDPNRPEAVVYWYDPPRPMLLVAFMYRVHEGHEPAFARSVLPWHSHCDGWSVVMHTWFTNDLRSGLARKTAARRVRDDVQPRLRRPHTGLGFRLPAEAARGSRRSDPDLAAT
jgi:hypothetical protein